ncbi:MAG: hypothetical protein Q7T55_12255, partial [Solirubrobacteraceae bacterium]|nr:hypothetical protein [Solirubrobacteraceae bacterium]
MDVEVAHTGDPSGATATTNGWDHALTLLGSDLARRGLATRTRRAYAADLTDLATWAAARDL